MPRLIFRSHLPVAAEDLFRWHISPGAFGRLAPPFESIEMIGDDGGLSDGDIRHLLMGFLGPLKVNWTASHDQWIEGRRFRDTQQNGPFAHWAHTHRFLPAPGGCLLEDEIDYKLPFEGLTEALAGPLLRARIRRTFLFRHWRTRFDALRRPARPGGRVILSGATGLVGRELRTFLMSQGFEVLRLVRRPPRGRNEAQWEPYSCGCPPQVLEGARAVIHLSGHGVIDGNWNERHRRLMWDSRVVTTRSLVTSMKRCSKPPEVLITASGAGYYGDRPDPVDEGSDPGQGFLAELCQAWEAESQRVESTATRAVQLRIGAILTPRGGALAQMLLPFRLGLGATIGGGRAPFAWISLEDLVGLTLYCLQTESIRGPVNAVAPQQVDFRGFADCLAQVLHRPRWLDVPPWVLRPILGPKLQLLLAGPWVIPRRILESGFKFLLPELYPALKHELGRYDNWEPPQFESEQQAKRLNSK